MLGEELRMQTLKLQFTNYSIQLITEQALDFFKTAYAAPLFNRLKAKLDNNQLKIIFIQNSLRSL